MEELAAVLYRAYLESSGGLNYEGKPCPTWGELPEAIQKHWRAVGDRADMIFNGPVDGIDPPGSDPDGGSDSFRGVS